MGSLVDQARVVAEEGASLPPGPDEIAAGATMTDWALDMTAWATPEDHAAAIAAARPHLREDVYALASGRVDGWTSRRAFDAGLAIRAACVRRMTVWHVERLAGLRPGALKGLEVAR